MMTTIAMENPTGSEPSPIAQALLVWAEYWYPISWKGVLVGGIITAIGACATIAFLLLQWRTTAIREQHSEWRTSALELQTADAKADLGKAQADIANAQARIAEADARSKEAELKLEQLRERLRPRQIKGSSFLKILEGKPKAPVEILFVRDDGEAFQLSLQIRDFLKQATWSVEEPRHITQDDVSPRLERNHPYTMAAGGQPQGVSLFLRAESQADFEREADKIPLNPDRPLDTPRKALSAALLDSLGTLSGGMSYENGRPGVLRVIVGPKPQLN
jgi:hypothetical protein